MLNMQWSLSDARHTITLQREFLYWKIKDMLNINTRVQVYITMILSVAQTWIKFVIL